MSTEEGTADATANPSGSSATEGNPGADKGDYIARVKTDPDFAAEEIRKKDRLVSELQGKSSKYKELEPYYEQLGGGQGVLGLVQVALNVQNNPDLNRIVTETLRTGRVPAAEAAGSATGEEDIYVDPDVKALRTELQGLKSELSQSTQRLASAEMRGFQGGIEKNVQRFMDKWGGNPEVAAKASGLIQEKVREAEQAATRGDEQARRLLDSLAQPSGLKSLEFIALEVIDDNLEAIANARASGAAGDVLQHATDAPATTRSVAGEALPEPVKGMTIEQRVQQALEFNTRKAGLNPDQAW